VLEVPVLASTGAASTGAASSYEPAPSPDAVQEFFGSFRVPTAPAAAAFALDFMAAHRGSPTVEPSVSEGHSFHRPVPSAFVGLECPVAWGGKKGKGKGSFKDLMRPGDAEATAASFALPDVGTPDWLERRDPQPHRREQQPAEFEGTTTNMVSNTKQLSVMVWNAGMVDRRLLQLL
jgi:hypothetical protein